MYEIEDPEKEAEYLINWPNKTVILDVDMAFLYDMYDDNFDDDEDANEDDMKKYLVLSYKSESINTYNVFVFDISTKLIRFWYETYHLYENKVKGFMLPTNEFFILNDQGMHVINLGNAGQRIVTDHKTG